MKDSKKQDRQKKLFTLDARQLGLVRGGGGIIVQDPAERAQ